MEARVAVVGDYDSQNETHRATDDALGQLPVIAFEWLATDAVEPDAATVLSGFAGVWIAPASPYRSMDGALHAIRYARERGVPLVGT